MNRVDFMQQLESLLQSIAPAERDEALQYYNDYFDDAGKENEQEVIEALGNPARVAENIRRDLLNNGYGDNIAKKASAFDRALVEYGKEPQDTAGGNGSSGNASYGNGSSGNTTYGNTVFSRPEQGDHAWTKGRACMAGKKGTPSWATPLVVLLLIFTSPMWLGLIGSAVGILLGTIGVLIGVIAAWFAMIIAFGAAFISLFVALVVLVVVGFMCIFTNPWVGLALIGSGLVCGGLGILFLMLTVAMAGIATPAIFRGISRLFRFVFQKKPVKGVA